MPDAEVRAWMKRQKDQSRVLAPGCTVEKPEEHSWDDDVWCDPPQNSEALDLGWNQSFSGGSDKLPGLRTTEQRKKAGRDLANSLWLGMSLIDIPDSTPLSQYLCLQAGQHSLSRAIYMGSSGTPFQFPCAGALGHIPSHGGLSITTGEQGVSLLGPKCKVSAETAWGKWGTLTAPSFGWGTVWADT